MLAWSEWTDNGRQKTMKSWLWRHYRRRAILLITPITLANLSRCSKPKSAALTPASSRWRDAYRKQLGLHLPKSLWLPALQQIKERGALPMIDSDIRQAIDRCSNIWASLPGAGYGRLSIRPTAWLQNSKKGGTVREIDARWAAHDTAWLSASSACHGC